MAFYATIGYKFALDDDTKLAGSLVLASTVAMHGLERRRLDQHPHLERRLFDPQLYLAGLDAAQCKKHCARLASYPWFGIGGLKQFDSAEHKQKGWMEEAIEKIASTWPGQAPSDGGKISVAVRECIEFQQRFGCWAILLPSPLTIDPSTNYNDEEAWLDASLDFVEGLEEFNLPKFATVAISDACLRLKPKENTLLDIIGDSVSAREGLDGVYLVVEQAGEAPDTRNCGSQRTLESVLRLVHNFAKDAGLRVGVSFLGPFGLACEAAGAEWWSSNWYVSLRRLRMADVLGGGRAYPLYWSGRAAIDVHLDKEFDKLVKAGHLSEISDKTSASDGLLAAASKGRRVSQVAPWAFRQSNVTATAAHYLQSAAQLENRHAKLSGKARLDLAEKWLDQAAKRTVKVEGVLGVERKTKTQHVQAWLNAFRGYRKLHKV